MVFHEVITEADPECWHLDDFVDANGSKVDLCQFTSSQRLVVQAPLHCRVSIGGRESDFTLTSSGAPVASQALSQQLFALAPSDLQLVPLQVEGSAKAYSVVNVLPRVQALDEERSIGGRWPEGSAAAGHWLYISHAALRARFVNGHALFRVHEWMPPIFCSDAVREVLEPQEWTGLLFRPTR